MVNRQVFTIGVFQLQANIIQHRHMFWHVKYRETNEPHTDNWHTDSETQLMDEYVARHNKGEYVSLLLEEHRRETPYSCSGPRLHIRERENVDKQTSEAEK